MYRKVVLSLNALIFHPFYNNMNKVKKHIIYKQFVMKRKIFTPNISFFHLKFAHSQKTVYLCTRN